MKPYRVFLWKTVVLEVTVQADNADAARDEADALFAGGEYDGRWEDAETANVQTICEESDQHKELS